MLQDKKGRIGTTEDYIYDASSNVASSWAGGTCSEYV